MLAIAKREFKAFFSSPIGYVCVAVILALYGFFYYQALKDSITSSYENVLQTKIVNVYNVDACVTIHEERYSDYTSLENNYSSSSSSSTSAT